MFRCSSVKMSNIDIQLIQNKVSKEEWKPLLRGVEILGFCQTGQLVLVAREAAEEDGTAQGQQSRPPAKTIGPAEEVVTLEDQVLELDWVYDESDDLNDHDDDEQDSNERQQCDVDSATQSNAGDDEGHDEDEEADDHESRDRLSPRVLHQRLAAPLVVPAAAVIPHTGVVRLGVLVLDPSRRRGDGDYVKNNGEDQQQGHDPPASGIGDTTAKHVRALAAVFARGREDEETRTSRG